MATITGKDGFMFGHYNYTSEMSHNIDGMTFNPAVTFSGTVEIPTRFLLDGQNIRYDGLGEITPTEYLMAASEVLDTITLDPASSSFANKHVCAETYFAASDRSLDINWFGNVWLNPPWKINTTENTAWIAKLLSEYKVKRVNAAIAMLPVVNFAHVILEAGDTEVSFCLCRKPSMLYDRTMTQQVGENRSNMFIYVGDKHGLFMQVFSRYGAVFSICGEQEKIKPWSYDASL